MFLSLQTYGIVQQEGEVEYMTFVLSVEEDGPAYMAGLRPGRIRPDISVLRKLYFILVNCILY